MTMDDFTKYQAMSARGDSPRKIYQTAEADGLDPITRIRLVRKICGLSLAEAKQVSGAADILNFRQEISPGATLYWEGWATDEGFYLMQGRVSRVEDDKVLMEDLKKFRPSNQGVEEVPLSGNGATAIPIRYFDKTLAERILEAMEFIGRLSQINRAGT
jgi:hypothetical protein